MTESTKQTLMNAVSYFWPYLLAAWIVALVTFYLVFDTEVQQAAENYCKSVQWSTCNDLGSQVKK